MARRSIHYEAAFEDYLRSRGWPYVPVDEKKKAIFAGARIKSFDFIVYRPGHRGALIDVKGRKFPYRSASGARRYWENWVTTEDIEGLRRWEGAFGDDFETGFVFAYWLLGSPDRDPPGDIHPFRGEYYSFLWVSAADYADRARCRSPKWNTVSVSAKDFRGMARPLSDRATA